MTNSSFILLGLPGLYQNWLLAALDPGAATTNSGGFNVLTNGSKYTWYRKLELDLPNFIPQHGDSVVVNTFVEDQNFVWYLYNFLEKTDDVGIYVDNLINDLFTKAPGTIAFDSLLKHMIDNFQLTPEQDFSHKFNSAVENFYLTLINQSSEFKTKAAYQDPGIINIEFRDFEDGGALINQLKHLPGFDCNYFEKKYHELSARNEKYIKKQEQFLSKLESHDPVFDVLETAYIGWLLWSLNPVQLDWFNTSVRETSMKKHWNELCDFAIKCYNKKYV